MRGQGLDGGGQSCDGEILQSPPPLGKTLLNEKVRSMVFLSFLLEQLLKFVLIALTVLGTSYAFAFVSVPSIKIHLSF